MTRLDEIVLISKMSAALDETPMFVLLEPGIDRIARPAILDFAVKHDISGDDSRRIFAAARRAQIARRSVISQQRVAA